MIDFMAAKNEYVKGKKDERERIIKIMEKKMAKASSCFSEEMYVFDVLEELIKQINKKEEEE